jgi:hypothetical protein
LFVATILKYDFTFLSSNAYIFDVKAPMKHNLLFRILRALAGRGGGMLGTV